MIIYDDMYKNSITMYISLYLCVFFALKSVYYTLCTHYIELLYIFWSACWAWCGVVMCWCAVKRLYCRSQKSCRKPYIVQNPKSGHPHTFFLVHSCVYILISTIYYVYFM